MGWVITVRKLADSVFSDDTKLAAVVPIRRTWETEALSFTVSIYGDGGRRGRTEGIKLQQLACVTTKATGVVWGPCIRR